jgi:hypothetical protein
MTNNHAKRNVIQHRELIVSGGMNSSAQSRAKSQSQKDEGSSNNVAAVRTKASILAEQSSAIVTMAADFRTTFREQKALRGS